MKKKASSKTSAKKSAPKLADLKPKKNAKGGSDYVVWRRNFGANPP